MIQADDRLKAIFDEAVKIAKSHSHEYVTLEHLLFVLLLQPEVDDLLIRPGCGDGRRSPSNACRASQRGRAP